MDVPRPDGPDVNRDTSIFIGLWALTAVVGVILAFRFGVKAWVRWFATVNTPRRVFGIEDFFFALGYAFDLGHMSMIWISYEHGLGRHFFYLTPIEKNMSMKYDFISQPLAVSAAMWSRTGVILFLYTCFAEKKKTLQIVVLACLAVQMIINLITILQIFLQCGPNPYRLADRAAYFHYMWDPLPDDGSVVCQHPTTQALIGYIQGGFNTVIDWLLAYLAGYEIWHFLFRATASSNTSLRYKFKQIDPNTRSQRIWQTILLVGPLVISGAASIIKTYLLSALGSRLDFTWNIVPFILWVKIENYCIPIAATAPVLRLFVRTVMQYKTGTDSDYTGSHGSTQRTRVSRTHSGAVELTDRSAGQWSGKKGTFVSTISHSDDIYDERKQVRRQDRGSESTVVAPETGLRPASLHGSENELVGHCDRGDIMVRTEYEVRYESGDDLSFPGRL